MFVFLHSNSKHKRKKEISESMEPPKTTASVRSSATVFSISSLGGEPVTAPSNKDVKPKVNMKRTVERERERERETEDVAVNRWKDQPAT